MTCADTRLPPVPYCLFDGEVWSLAGRYAVGDPGNVCAAFAARRCM